MSRSTALRADDPLARLVFRHAHCRASAVQPLGDSRQQLDAAPAEAASLDLLVLQITLPAPFI